MNNESAIHAHQSHSPSSRNDTNINDTSNRFDGDGHQSGSPLDPFKERKLQQLLGIPHVDSAEAGAC